ncbi:hypothetical protein AVEN_266254-1 [Araneus ventricosus]|uniref:Uncharacterized protein n=1 Tax=Araneus ventricosus TaxID=182803 RepID=A0A4Y2WXT3_ARAVE|nr:hypothetical protein AVEN_266254-1 [Araneus ventricosus]
MLSPLEQEYLQFILMKLDIHEGSAPVHLERDIPHPSNFQPFHLGNQSIGQYLSAHKDFFSNPPTDRRLEEVVVSDWSKMMKFKAL